MKIEVNDIVTIVADVSFTDDEGNVQMRMKDCDGRVLFLFRDWQNVDACILEVNGVQTPFRLTDLRLKEKAPMPAEKEEHHENPEPYEVLKNFVATIPRWSIAYVYQINDELVAARSIEEAIGIFYQSKTEQVVIDNVKLLNHNHALVQNEIPLI